jgi:membrane-associated phospholipid phosphatase
MPDCKCYAEFYPQHDTAKIETMFMKLSGRWNGVRKILLALFFASGVFPVGAYGQDPLPTPHYFSSSPEKMIRIPSAGDFDFAKLRLDRFKQTTTGDAADWQEPAGSGSAPQVQTQTREANSDGLVKRSLKQTWRDQKELYKTPFRRSNLKWNALVLGGTGVLLVYDRHIETHIGKTNESAYNIASDATIGGLGAALAGVWVWGLKNDQPHAKELGFIELQALVNTFLIYTPMQLLAARQRPDDGNGRGDFWMHHNINTSFPGGHTMFTFAMATVLSHEYPQKWVQVLAYTAATLITVTRFMGRDHWSSDMFAGTALGIGIGAITFHLHCDPNLSDSCKHHVRWIF